MKFEEIIGQESAINGLISLYQSEKLPHALLLSGMEGTGGLPLALAFAQFVLCEQKTMGDSCGSCPSCLKVSKLAHPDLHLTFPTIPPKPSAKSFSADFLNEFREFVKQTPYNSTYDWLQFINAENRQGNISADECRQIIEQLNLTAYEGAYKIQIIWRPEYLGKEGNLLLKLIEEPPAKTLILMVAESPNLLLKTILSRSQIVQLAPLSMEVIAEALQAKHKVEQRQALQVAGIAQPSYSRALALLQFTHNDQFPLLRNWFNGIFTGNRNAINEWVEDCAKEGREQQKSFLTYAQQILAHALRAMLIPDYQPPVLEDEVNFIHRLAKQNLSPYIYQEMAQVISKTIYHIERNASSKIQLLALSIRLQGLVGKK